MTKTHALIVIVSIFYCVNSRITSYDSSYVYLLAINEDTGTEQSFCVNFEQWKTQKIADSRKNAEILRLGWWGGIVNNTDVCRSNASLQYNGQAIPLNYRLGSQSDYCVIPYSDTNDSFKSTLQFQVDLVIAQNGSAALMLVDKGHKFKSNWADYLFMDFYDPSFNQSTSLPTFFIYRSTFLDELLALSKSGSGQDLKLLFYRPPSTQWDISLLFVWLIAMFCVGAGGHWAGHRKLCEEQTSADRKLEQIVVSDTSSTRTKDLSLNEKALPQINCFFIVIVMCIVVGVLMLGFYFRTVMVYFFNVLIVVIGTFSVYRCLNALFGSFSKCGQCRVCISMNDVTRSIFRRDLFNCEWCSERPRVASVFIFIFALILCITWFFIRRNAYAFILLDFINITLCLHVLKGIRFPNLKWLTILLLCMFVYDIFMVFGTPYLTKNGCSVMVEVAAGGDCSSEIGYPIAPVQSDIPEKLPMLFQVPRLSDPMLSCVDIAIEKEYRPVILGLGDIIIPGYLISFCFTVDFAVSARYVYGMISIAGYGIGLVVTFIALSLMEMAQPALIYLIPFTLLPIVILAAVRHELKPLWTGDFLRENDIHSVLEGCNDADARHSSESTAGAGATPAVSVSYSSAFNVTA